MFIVENMKKTKIILKITYFPTPLGTVETINY